MPAISKPCALADGTSVIVAVDPEEELLAIDGNNDLPGASDEDVMESNISFGFLDGHTVQYLLSFFCSQYWLLASSQLSGLVMHAAPLMLARIWDVTWCNGNGRNVMLDGDGTWNDVDPAVVVAVIVYSISKLSLYTRFVPSVTRLAKVIMLLDKPLAGILYCSHFRAPRYFAKVGLESYTSLVSGTPTIETFAILYNDQSLK